MLFLACARVGLGRSFLPMFGVYSVGTKEDEGHERVDRMAGQIYKEGGSARVCIIRWLELPLVVNGLALWVKPCSRFLGRTLRQ